MNDRGVVDAHVHFWDPAQLRYPWLESVPALREMHGPEEFAKQSGAGGVSAAVFVECDVDPQMAGAEVSFVEGLVARLEADGSRAPPILAIVAHAPLHEGAGARRSIEALAQRPLVRGVRRLLQDEADAEFCLRDPFVEGVQSLADYDLSMDLCIRHHQLPGVIGLARRVPDVRMVLDHAGKPDIRAALLDPWRARLRELSRLEHVSCKLSGLVTEADPVGWTAEDLRPFVEHVIECFGFDRVLYGGDWPVVDLAGGYARWWNAITELTAACSASEKARLFGDNARAFYRLGEPTDRASAAG